MSNGYSFLAGKRIMKLGQINWTKIIYFLQPMVEMAALGAFIATLKFIKRMELLIITGIRID